MWYSTGCKHTYSGEHVARVNRKTLGHVQFQQAGERVARGESKRKLGGDGQSLTVRVGLEAGIVLDLKIGPELAVKNDGNGLDILVDMLMVCPQRYFVDYLLSAGGVGRGNRAYRYVLSGADNVARVGSLVPLELLFGKHLARPANESLKRLSKRLIQLWTDFAKNRYVGRCGYIGAAHW
ncbi:hypothetical protein HPB49_008109 [Dermacentor silvarum]|uniref:Uncharacterized protein n=1 Tax=Dermacentor silvarum TaxID=543639 RepID=A0ACB8CW54_DERSI|nr:hypothetical protein HPB49_008109 [Dermacentor silvarum]